MVSGSLNLRVNPLLKVMIAMNGCHQVLGFDLARVLCPGAWRTETGEGDRTGRHPPWCALKLLGELFG